MLSLIGHVLLVALTFFVIGMVAGHYTDVTEVNTFRHQTLWVALITVFVWFPAMMLGIWISLKWK
jgi:hypothetical protein